ncbi:MAG: NAD-dependent epimerase/dehydratase family protein, partial [Cyanobacteria bacterium M_surface_9_m1_291]|nr:NAD-dependent epimerase/dehydratase family protein [Cyanobacteria bacterium M_surface_9_m1_291]
HVLPALIRRFHEAKEAGAASVTCWGSGTPMREFLHVDDLGAAAVFALEHWNPDAPGAPRGVGPGGEDLGPLNHLNVGTGVDVTIREAAETVAAVVGFNAAIDWDTSKPDGTPRKLLDVSRLAALGWRAQIGLREGLSSTYTDFAAELARDREAVRL